jgi:hypothetical protein
VAVAVVSSSRRNRGVSRLRWVVAYAATNRSSAGPGAARVALVQSGQEPEPS